MDLLPMYKAMINSPILHLGTDISATATQFTVTNTACLPDAPNIATFIGEDENDTETVIYTEKTANMLRGVQRGFQGAAKAWLEGTRLVRLITAYDHDTFIKNIEKIHAHLDNQYNPHHFTSFIIVGLESAGYTEADADILVPATATNCKSYLDDAIAAVPEQGGTILLLAGKYDYDSPWGITRNNVHIQGMGDNTVLNMIGPRSTTNSEAATKSNNAVIYFSGTGCTDCSLKNIQLIHPAGNRATGISIGSGASDIAIEYVTIAVIGTSSYSSVSIALYLAKDITLKKCVLKNTLGNTSSTYSCHAIQINTSNATDINISENTFENYHGGSSGVCNGVRIESGLTGIERIKITDNVIANYSRATMAVGISVLSTVSNVIISGNTFMNSRTTGQSTTVVFAIHFSQSGSGNQITDNDFTGVTKVIPAGSAYTTDTTTVTSPPGSETSLGSFGIGGIFGQNLGQ